MGRNVTMSPTFSEDRFCNSTRLCNFLSARPVHLCNNLNTHKSYQDIFRKDKQVKKFNISSTTETANISVNPYDKHYSMINQN